MPTPGKAWWRVDVGTYCSWLSGDERGFRNRNHRIHSSGDYKHRPAPGEHQGLRNFNLARCPEPVTLPRGLRLKVATKIAEVLLNRGHRVLVVSCADRHSHAVAELPIDEREFNKAIGTAKCQSSSAIRKALPRRVWGRDDKHDMLRDRPYQINAVKYVRNKQGPQAAAWCVDGLRREAKKE